MQLHHMHRWLHCSPGYNTMIFLKCVFAVSVHVHLLYRVCSVCAYRESGIKIDLTLPIEQGARLLVKYTLLTLSPALRYQETERTGSWHRSHLSDLCLAESLVNGPETDSDVLIDGSFGTHMAVHKSTCTHARTEAPD